MEGKAQRKCSPHHILSILLAVPTRVFWRPLSVNQPHLTNLIQHFLEMFPSQYPARWLRAHRHAGSAERTRTPLLFMTITDKTCTGSATLRLHANIRHLCTAWLEDTWPCTCLAPAPAVGTCAHGGSWDTNLGNKLCSSGGETGLQ